METIWKQIGEQPRTKEGGFQHKDVYPNQMWLDGLYMAQPYYAEYVKRNITDEDEAAEYYSDIIHHFVTAAKYTCDEQTKLFRHAWDSSHSMFWADPVTGQSKHVWGRALGWFMMGIVETLDYIPVDHPERQKLLTILEHLYNTLPQYADKESGMWYQVLSLPEREGNYQEATCSMMITYSYIKGVSKGYLASNKREYAMSLYDKFIDRFVREGENGLLSIIDCCRVAGLGGSSMRSGTFDYYISEPIIENDCKAVGPFIWASLEYETLTK